MTESKKETDWKGFGSRLLDETVNVLKVTVGAILGIALYGWFCSRSEAEPKA